MTDLMRVHDIIIKRYPTPTKVKGRYTKGSPTTITTLAHIQPLDFSAIGGEVLESHPRGDNVKEYSWIFSYIELKLADVITDVATSEVFRVIKVYPFLTYNVGDDHYEAVMVREDAD